MTEVQAAESFTGDMVGQGVKGVQRIPCVDLLRPSLTARPLATSRLWRSVLVNRSMPFAEFNLQRRSCGNLVKAPNGFFVRGLHPRGSQ